MTITEPSPPLTDKAEVPHRRRRWPRRLLIGVDVFLAVCVLGGLTLYGYVSYRFGEIHKVTLHFLSPVIPRSGTPRGGSGNGGTSILPMNILVVGSDTRAALSDAAQFGGSLVGGARSDTIMIVHLDPATESASLLSIPRDLWVPIPGQGTNRINTAFDTSPDLLVRTIQEDLGIAINHYVDVDFDTFRQVVNALGGVKFWYPEPVRDNDNGVNDSGLNITVPGCYTLDGNMALSLVRTRHLEYEENGRWIFEAQSDLARIRRQQLFVKKVITKAEAQGLTSITKLNGVVGGIVDNITVDASFSQSLMISLARRYHSFNPGTLPTATLPTTGAVIGGADVLLLQQAPAQEVIDLWQGIQPPPQVSSAVGSGDSVSTTSTTAAPGALTPSGVVVGVLNGTGISHQASAAVTALQGVGFDASISGNGSADNFNYPMTEIDYPPDDLAQAQLLQSAITGGATLHPDPTMNDGAVILITGAGYSGVQAPNPAAVPTTTSPPTTAAPTAAASALAAVPGNSSDAPAFPGIHGQDPAPAGC